MNSSKNGSTAIQIVPTCIPQSADDMRAGMRAVSAFSSAIHLDIDDGVFTPNASWPFDKKGSERREVKGIDTAIDTPVDNFLMQVHLMVSGGRELHTIAEDFINAGAGSLIAHVESLEGDTDTLGAWALLGVGEIGVAILIDTPLEKLDPLLPFCDFIHVMSVAAIGAQGAPFEPRAIERVKTLHEAHPDFPIAVDGGVSLDNIASLVRAGATRFSIGSDIMRAPDPAQEYAYLKAAAENALQ